MRWDQEMELSLPVRVSPMVPGTIIGPAKRFRHPAVQAEVERRVAIYTRQIEEQGFIIWLPHRGSGM